MSRVEGFISRAIDEGGEELIAQGEPEPSGKKDTGGFFMRPRIFANVRDDMQIARDEVFGPVAAIFTFETTNEVIERANSTDYGLGAGVWSRNGNEAYRAGRDIQAGRVWVNNYHAYPAGAAFGGYKSSGIGRENNKLALDHYQQTKNLLVSYSENPLGFF